MRKLSLTLFSVAMVACGSDAAKSPDAAKAIDAKPIDAKVFLDGAGSGSASYNFSCLNAVAPTNAADPVTLAGTTETFNGSALTQLPMVTVDTYKTGTVQPVDTKTSDANGAFTTGAIATAAAPFDGYIKGSKATYRTSYIYPPNKVVANLAGVPVPMISDALVTQYQAVLQQNDTANGMLFISVADCALMPISGSTLSVKQNGAEVGTKLELSAINPALAGIYLVSNVPDGDTTVSGSYSGMTFPSHVVVAHKKPAGANAEGTLTVSAVVPGFF
jgi:hypothetical protein